IHAADSKVLSSLLRAAIACLLMGQRKGSFTHVHSSASTIDPSSCMYTVRRSPPISRIPSATVGHCQRFISGDSLSDVGIEQRQDRALHCDRERSPDHDDADTAPSSSPVTQTEK